MSSTEAQLQAFSSPGEDAITRSLDVSSEKTPAPGSSSFFAYYEIENTVRKIEQGNYKRFPDELLHDSVPIFRTLQERLGPQREAYVLADTSYGSCCVDEVAASHVDADVLVHYGHACLSQTSRLPIIYVFGQKTLNVEDCVDKISTYLMDNVENLRDTKVLHLRHDVGFTHLGDELARLLRLATNDRYCIKYEHLPEQTIPRSAGTNDPHQAGRSAAINEPIICAASTSSSDSSLNRTLMVWVGEEPPTLTKILMTSSGSNVISYNPQSGVVQEQTYRTNKLLMRRYAILQKARDADVFGILVGTLGVASYLPLMKYLRERLKRAHKKSYTVSVGKINPAKLANFMEIECWVWVACSEGIVDSKDYLRPIITPYELELALQPEPDWTGKYIFDFEELLAKASLDGENEERKEDADLDRPMFSLVSGTYRHAKRYGVGNDEKEETVIDSKELTVRTQDNALTKMDDSAAAQFLHARSYQGLDPRLGQDAPSLLEQGRSGIARGYSDDHRESTG
ncbi:diphthamide biosynthesis protein [Fomitiporia mediterranea MF3/22]|uniref:diphthamide biosynthesis protein n=1 Tax=Fomitiporia mediterranea (strain MF3/22) TaxID=694068 RepID=UPI0004408DF6|nr:diphthamide biosynthesis protein [Fomitiporia mediterranea MF3/22]EJC98372.1 diphthamide biosynthesis protein [Fomitiporia mediterranea MF3/22]